MKISQVIVDLCIAACYLGVSLTQPRKVINMPAFDPRGIELDPEIEVVDNGEYAVEIYKCVDKIDNFGQRVKVLYKVISPDADAGKLLIENFNIGHGKPEVEKIGKSQFKKLLRCIGMENDVLENFGDIEGKKLKIEVEVVPHYKDVTQTQNKIKKHMKATGESAQKLHSKDEDLPF